MVDELEAFEGLAVRGSEGAEVHRKRLERARGDLLMGNKNGCFLMSGTLVAEEERLQRVPRLTEEGLKRYCRKDSMVDTECFEAKKRPKEPPFF